MRTMYAVCTIIIIIAIIINVRYIGELVYTVTKDTYKTASSLPSWPGNTYEVHTFLTFLARLSLLYMRTTSLTSLLTHNHKCSE